jgi:alcohol dehydrogenase YqhD (iron-dependent ADH family)
MDKNTQLGEFACYFYQNFGEGSFDTLENNISSFFSSTSYVNGGELIEQIDTFEKVNFSLRVRGSAWRDLGGAMWIKELGDPRTWEVIKGLAKDYQNSQIVLSKRDEFDDRLHRLLEKIE